MLKKVAVLMGGFSSEKKMSLKSGDVIFNNIDRSKYEPFKVIVEKYRWHHIDENNQLFEVCFDDFSIFKNEEKIVFDIAFIIIHGPPGEDGLIQSYFQLKNIPYTGSDSYTSSLTFNKRDCISVLSKYDIPVANSVHLNYGDSFSTEKIISKLGLPCFVKANRSGSSFGVFKVNKVEDLENFINKAFEFDNEILIESYLQGTEVSVGVMNYKDEIKVFGITELITENDFFDLSAKYEGKAQEITPARIPQEQTEMVKTLTAKIYRILEMNGVCRADFIIENNQAYFIELNSTPGLSEASLIPKQVAHSGLDLTEFFNRLIQETLIKHK